MICLAGLVVLLLPLAVDCRTLTGSSSASVSLSGTLSRTSTISVPLVPTDTQTGTSRTATRTVPLKLTETQTGTSRTMSHSVPHVPTETLTGTMTETLTGTMTETLTRTSTISVPFVPTDTQTGTSRTATRTVPLKLTETQTGTSRTMSHSVPHVPTETLTGTSRTPSSTVPLKATETQTGTSRTPSSTVPLKATETQTGTSRTVSRTVPPPATGTRTFTTITASATKPHVRTDTFTPTSRTTSKSTPPTPTHTKGASSEVTATVVTFSSFLTKSVSSSTSRTWKSFSLTNTTTVSGPTDTLSGTVTRSPSRDGRSLSASGSNEGSTSLTNASETSEVTFSDESVTRSPTGDETLTQTSVVSETAILTSSHSILLSPTKTLRLAPYNAPIPLALANISFVPSSLRTDNIPEGVLGAVNISMTISLPGNYRWTVLCGNFISFRYMDLGTLPERQGWFYTAGTPHCERSEQNLNVVVCNIPRAEGYQIAMSEYVAVAAGSQAFETGAATAETVIAILTLNPTENPPLVLSAAHGVTAVVAIELFLASLFGAQSGVFDGQFIAFAGQMTCASNLDKEMTFRMMYLVAPLTDYGSIAVVYFNIFLVICFTVTHTAATYIYHKWKKVCFTDACEKVAFPSLTYCCAVYFHAGIAYGTCQLALNGNTYWERVACIIGIAYVACFHLAIILQLGKWVRVSFVVYGIRSSFSPALRFFAPLGFWEPKQPRLMFGRMINTLGPGAKHLTSYPIILVSCMAVLSSVRPDHPNCRVLLAVMSGVFFISGAFVAIRRPHRVPVQNTTTVIMYTLLAVQQGIQASASSDRSLDFVNSKAVLWLVQLCFIAVRTVVDLCIMYYEATVLAPHREPKFAALDEDKFLVTEQRLKNMFMDDLMAAPLPLSEQREMTPKHQEALRAASIRHASSRMLSLREEEGASSLRRAGRDDDASRPPASFLAGDVKGERDAFGSFALSLRESDSDSDDSML